MYCIFSPKDTCSLTRLTSCVFQFLLEVEDVIIISGLISMSLSHLRDNQTGPPVTPESALHNIGGKVIAKIDDFVPRNIYKFLNTFLNQMCKNLLKYILFDYTLVPPEKTGVFVS